MNVRESIRIVNLPRILTRSDAHLSSSQGRVQIGTVFLFASPHGSELEQICA
jgi:hypothetical protein